MAQNTIQSPCPIALILSEGTNSSEQNSSTHDTILIHSTSPCVMALILSEGTNSIPLLYEQLWVKQLQTILNFSPLDSGGGHLNK